MNDQLSATDLGLNPYAPGGIGGERNMVAGNSERGADPRSEGLNGSTLDTLLRSRWMEGHGAGYDEGHAAARQRYVAIFDEAFAGGARYGGAFVSREILNLAAEPLQQIMHDLGEIEGRTSSEDIKERTQRGLGLLAEFVAEMKKRYEAQSAEPGNPVQG